MPKVVHAVSRLLHDLEMVFRDGSRHVLRGTVRADMPGTSSTYTYNLPADLFHQWIRDNKGFPPVDNGDIEVAQGLPDEPIQASPADADQQTVDRLANLIEQHFSS